MKEKPVADPWLRGQARFAVILLQATDPATDLDALLRPLGRMVRVGGRSRDFASLRVRIRRLRARLYAAAGRHQEAVHESLVADRAVMRSLRFAEIDHKAWKEERGRYTRSRETMMLCHRALSYGIDCARYEKDTMGARTFFDFSREPTRGPFDQAESSLVLAEYQSALHKCLEAGARANLLKQTSVEVEWAVENSGKVGSFDLRPSRLVGTSVHSCFREAFSVFRYRPYRGEMHHVGMTFYVE